MRLEGASMGLEGASMGPDPKAQATPSPRDIPPNCRTISS